VVAECDQLVARQDGLEPLLALEERQRMQVLAVCEHEVECAVQKLSLVAQGVLKQLKMGYAILPDRDELAIDHGVRLHALECFRDLDIGVADDFPVAAVEHDPPAPDFRDHAESIEFVLEDRIGIVER
jgi:hypothetical protein